MAGAVALVATGATTSVALASGGGGASTPGAAVTALFSSLENADVVGMLGSVAPGERAAIEPGLEDIVAQLKRLGILSPSAALSHIAGLSYQFANLDMTTDQFSPTVAAVTVAATSETGTVNPSQLPLGSLIEDLVNIEAQSPGQPASTTTEDGPELFGTIEVDGSWYVSIGYSIAMNALKASGDSYAPPPAAQALQPSGAATPQLAVQNLVSSLSDLNVGAMVSELDPGEMAALDAYSPDWLGQAQQAIDKVKGNLNITISNLGLTAQQLDDGTLVKFGGAPTVVVSDDNVRVSYANGCLTIIEGQRTQKECQSATASRLATLSGDLPAPVAAIVDRLENAKPDDGIVTVEENGLWYVSPVRTLLQSVVASLSEFEPGDLKAIIDNEAGIEAGFQKWLAQQFGPGGLGLGGTGLGGTGLGSSGPITDKSLAVAARADG